MVQDFKRITFDELNAVFQMVGLNPTPDALGSVLKDCKVTCPISLKNLVRVSARDKVRLVYNPAIQARSKR